MADLLFGFLCVRQRRAGIYRFNHGILIYSNQKFRTHYRYMAEPQLNKIQNLIEADLRRITNCYYVLRAID